MYIVYYTEIHVHNWSEGKYTHIKDECLNFLIPGITIKKVERPLIYRMEMITESLCSFHSLISFNKYWLNAYYLPGTVQDAWDTLVNKIGKNHALGALTS